MELTKYKSVGEWYEDIKAHGYTAPLTMCHQLDQTMKKYKLTFAETFNLFLTQNKIFVRGKMFIFDLSGYKTN